MADQSTHVRAIAWDCLTGGCGLFHRERRGPPGLEAALDIGRPGETDLLQRGRWVRSGVLSPACSAIVHPLRLGSTLTRALTYFPACSHGSGRAKHDRSCPSSSASFRSASPDPILAAAAAFALVVVTHA
jgi:hypothetical protein